MRKKNNDEAKRYREALKELTGKGLHGLGITARIKIFVYTLIGSLILCGLIGWLRALSAA